MIEKDKERMDRPVPVNRNDYRAMYETLLACLIENGEPSHYLSYLEELYNSATRPAQPTVEEIDVEEIYRFLLSQVEKSRKIESISDKCKNLAKAIASRFGRPKIKLPEDIEPLCEIVHKAYCVWRLDDGQTPYWTEGDYSKLDDRTKEADRYTVRSVLNELRRLNGLEEE